MGEGTQHVLAKEIQVAAYASEAPSRSRSCVETLRTECLDIGRSAAC